MATPDDLAIRVLQQLQILGVGQSASAEEKLAALQKIQAVHASIEKDERVRWTLQRVPLAAQEPYVLMAAFLLAPQFPQVNDVSNWWQWGQTEINRLVSNNSDDLPTRTEYF